jgi:ferric-dicitrate binding protein FerR (iron transport regulator)
MNRERAIEIILQSGEGPPAGSVEHREFMAYLEKSPECRELYEQQQMLWQELDVWEAVEPSRGFDRRLAAALEADTPWWRRAFLSLQPGFAVGLAGLLLVASAVVRQQSDRVADPSVAVFEPAEDPQFYQRLDNALDDIEMLTDFEVLPLGPEKEDRS